MAKKYTSLIVKKASEGQYTLSEAPLFSYLMMTVSRSTSLAQVSI